MDGVFSGILVYQEKSARMILWRDNEEPDTNIKSSAVIINEKEGYVGLIYGGSLYHVESPRMYPEFYQVIPLEQGHTEWPADINYE